MKTILAVATAALSASVFAGNTCTWTGGAGDGKWVSSANWDTQPVSGNGDTVVLVNTGAPRPHLHHRAARGSAPTVVTGLLWNAGHRQPSVLFASLPFAAFAYRLYRLVGAERGTSCKASYRPPRGRCGAHESV